MSSRLPEETRNQDFPIQNTQQSLSTLRTDSMTLTNNLTSKVHFIASVNFLLTHHKSHA
jgi:hypothetical protein